MNSSLSETFRILSINIDKINSLKLLLQNNSYNIFQKIEQFINEFEYDLKLIYDILEEFHNSMINMKEDSNYEKDNIKNLTLSNRINTPLYLDNFDDFENNYKYKSKYDKNKENKKYSLTINICNDRYFNTKKRMFKKFNKSSSYKSHKKQNTKNLIKNLKHMKNNSFSERRNKNKINSNYMMKNMNNYYKFRSNINKNKDSLTNLNNLCNYYDELLNKKNYINTAYENNTTPRNLNNESNSNITPCNNKIDNISSEENSVNYINNYNYIKSYQRNNSYKRRNTYEIKSCNDKEIYQKIISEIMEDNNKLNELKKIIGDNIEQKILNKNLDNMEIELINNFLKKNNTKNKNDKNLFRKNYRNYRNYKDEENKYDIKNDILSSLKNNKIYNNINENEKNENDFYNNY